MSVEERASAAERVLAARERYVARGVSERGLGLLEESLQEAAEIKEAP